MSRFDSFFIKPKRFKTALNDLKNYSEFKIVINFVLSWLPSLCHSLATQNQNLINKKVGENFVFDVKIDPFILHKIKEI